MKRVSRGLTETTPPDGSPLVLNLSRPPVPQPTQPDRQKWGGERGAQDAVGGVDDRGGGAGADQPAQAAAAVGAIDQHQRRVGAAAERPDRARAEAAGVHHHQIRLSDHPGHRGGIGRPAQHRPDRQGRQQSGSQAHHRRRGRGHHQPAGGQRRGLDRARHGGHQPERRFFPRLRRRLQFQIEAEPDPAGQRQGARQARRRLCHRPCSEPQGRIHPGKVCRRHGRKRPAAAGGGVEIRIMQQHRRAAAGQPHIHLGPVGAEHRHAGQGLKRVLRCCATTGRCAS